LTITVRDHRHIHILRNNRQTLPILPLAIRNLPAHIRRSNSINMVVWLLRSIKEDLVAMEDRLINNTQLVQVASTDLPNPLDILKANGHNSPVTIHHLKATDIKPRSLFPMLVECCN
jgi:hypothetical protein